MLEVIPARWGSVFERFIESIQRQALFASPYISLPPIQRMVELLNGRNVHIEILTDLEGVWRGGTDPAALIFLMDRIPHTQVWYLPRLHAKVYVADDRQAIVTSANLTEPGIFLNYEYGVSISDPELVRRIRDDLQEYKHLGSPVSRLYLEKLAENTVKLQTLRRQMEDRAEQTLRDNFQHLMEETRVQLMEIRAEGKTTNGIFAETILYLLRKYGPLTTDQLHPLIQQIHPDLCDDTVDRIIRGVRFGKLWKHYVRNAQQTLKRQGKIYFDGQRWCLTAHAFRDT